MLWYLLFVAGI